jgi:hypothetical protein
MLKFAKFIGANTDFATSQAYLFPRVTQSGPGESVFGLVISAQGEDVFIAVRQKILTLEELFNSPFDRITDKLHELLEKLKNEFKELKNLKITLFCAKDDLFYVLQLGTNLVEIFREGRRMQVLGPGMQEKIVSGFIKPGDRILVLSSKPDNGQWSNEVVGEVFYAPFENIDDAEVVFAKDEQKVESQEDLAGVKEIQPVAFILIESGEFSQRKPEISRAEEKEDKPKFKINYQGFFLLLRKLFRRFLGFLRIINRKVLIAVIVILMLVAAGAGGYFYYQSQLSAKNARRENLVFLIDTALNQAFAFKDTDIKAAGAEVTKAQEKLRELESLDSKNPALEDIRRRIDERSAEVLKIYKNFDLELFMSLDLIKQNFQTKKLSFSVNKILLLDTGEKSLVSIRTDLKTPDILAGNQQLGDAQMASINGSSAFVYSRDKGFVHIDLDTDRVSVVSKPDEGWGEIRDVFGFSDNLYVLDSGKNRIWKYAPTGSGFSQKQEYLRSEADLSLGKELVIDYSVWVLTSEPDILKFTAGSSDFFALAGLDKPLTQIDGLYVTEELDSVFMLDKLNNRILVTKKNGEYLSQYIKPELSKVEDFFVDEEGKSIYLLMENKIFKTPLR